MAYYVFFSDNKWCEYLKNTNFDYKKSCYSEFNMMMAKKENNCELLENDIDKQSCYYSFAKEKRDPSFCTKLSMGEYVHNGGNSCYQEIAILIQDPQICDKIIINENRDWKDVCYLGASEKQPSKDICDKITRDYIRQECYKNLK